MFDIGWSELLVIGIVALIAIGPKELPGVLRMVGQWMGKVRRMASEFQGQFQEAMREAEMADIKKQVDDITTSTFDPLGDISKQFETAIEDKPAQTATPGEPAIATPSEPAVTQDNATVQPTSSTPNESDAAVPQPKVGSGA